MSDNPTFLHTFTTLFKRMLAEEVYTTFPAKIVSYSDGKAEIQPLVSRVYKNGESVTPEPIQNVPVIQPQTSNAIFKMPINEDDTGLAICTKTSLDSWLTGGEYSIQSIDRQFEMSDVVFIAGLIPFGNSDLTSNNDDLEIIFNDTNIKIKADGSIELDNGSGSIILGSDGSVDINSGNFKVIA